MHTKRFNKFRFGTISRLPYKPYERKDIFINLKSLFCETN